MKYNKNKSIIGIWEVFLLGWLFLFVVGCSKEDRYGPSVYSLLSAGQDHSLALEPDGTLWAWGENFVGQLGDGSTQNRNRPVKI